MNECNPNQAWADELDINEGREEQIKLRRINVHVSQFRTQPSRRENGHNGGPKNVAEFETGMGHRRSRPNLPWLDQYIFISEGQIPKLHV